MPPNIYFDILCWGSYLRNWHMCISYIHLYKSTTYKILSKGLLEPVCNWFGQVSLALLGVWLLRRSQATSLMCFKASTWELHSVTFRIVRRSIRQKACNACLPSVAASGGGGGGWGIYGVTEWDSTQKWFLKMIVILKSSRLSCEKWAPSRSHASTPSGKLKVRVTVDQSVTLQP